MRNFRNSKPDYNQRVKLFHRKSNEDGSLSNTIRPVIFYSKDERSFAVTMFDSDNSKVGRKNGSISTFDLRKGEITINDKVIIAGEEFTVISVLFEDVDRQKGLVKSPEVKTIIELVG